MITQLDSVTLRSGERMDMTRLVPPDPACLEGNLAAFYAHKGPNWYGDILRRLQGKLVDCSLDHFYLGKVNGEIVGGVWIGMPRDATDVGTLGHVFTPDRHRKKGICDALMAVCMKKFKEEGGKVLYLATGNPVARRIYENYGFRVYNPPQPESAQIFQWTTTDEKNFDEKFYAHAKPLKVREATWGDWTHLEALYNVPEHPWLIKDESLGVYKYVGYEHQFFSLMPPLEEKRGVCLLLENPNHRVVGVTRLTRSPRMWNSHVATLEFFVHEFYFADAAPLVKETLARCGSLGVDLVHAYAASGDKERVHILEQQGFKNSAVFKQQFKVKDASQGLDGVADGIPGSIDEPHFKRGVAVQDLLVYSRHS
jgi:GNAT superfamily N-acetyltransferase